jgi:XTP/dITP diphosphohydrolase
MPSTLIVLSARLGAVLPVAALPALRSAEQVYADHTVPEDVVAELGAERAGEWPSDGPPGDAWVLLTTDPKHAMGEHAHEVIETPEPPGAALLDAVAVMDRLRSPGGCPWDAEQTHRTLLQYLVEECYELHQAVEDADRPALREELGDVLLQVLFHSRLAQEGGVPPFPAGPASRTSLPATPTGSTRPTGCAPRTSRSGAGTSSNGRRRAGSPHWTGWRSASRPPRWPPS